MLLGVIFFSLFRNILLSVCDHPAHFWSQHKLTINLELFCSYETYNFIFQGGVHDNISPKLIMP